MEKFSAVLLLLYMVCFSCFLNGEVVHITVLTLGYTNIENTASQLQCYRSDAGVPFSFGRSAPITTSLAPPAGAWYGNNVRRVLFPDSNYWGTNGFGPFYCESSKEGRDRTRISTFFQRSDAKFIPSDRMFTKTVNVNDTNVMISMDIQTTSSNEIIWRKNGGSKLDMYNGQNQIIFTNPIQISDEGIYEIHYNTERTDNRGGLYRLIVRECPAGKWGPPECYGICDKCYNGGVCDDKSGLCICPNNFKGPNCLEICRPGGGNRFGLDCEFRCSYRNDGTSQCLGGLFCLPDPYGCSCDVGAYGLACNTLCTAGTYGPSCSQTCHCTSGSSCDIYTGGCTLGCQTGWSGDNCQIPDVCEAGYYGPECTDKCHCLDDASCDKQTAECPQRQCARGYGVRSGQVKCQECEGGTFGEDCLQQCHCAAEVCDKVTGTCNGQCRDSWIEPDCQTRISRLVPVKVNPYQPSSFTCYVEGNPPPSETSVNLYRYAQGNYDATGITRRSSSVSGSERAVVFDVDSVYQEDYVCSLAVGNGGSLTNTSTTYVLPVIGKAPVILSTTSTTVRLQWNAWSEEDDIGDPPLVGYDVLVKNGSNWVTDQRVDQSITSATVTNLNPDTDYRFKVAAVREGPGGTGEPSPRDSTVTLCGKPSDSPSVLEISANNPKELQVNWEPLPAESAACRSGVTNYTIYYTPAGSSTPNSVIVSNNTSSYSLTGLDIYLDYTIQITASNKDEESDRSIEVDQRTLEEVAPPPVNLAIPMSTTNSFTVSWSTPLPNNINGNITKYMIRYQQTAPVVDDDYKMEEVSVDVFEGEHTVTDLPSESNYTVEVQTVNGAGSSNWSLPVLAKTINTGGTPSPSIGPVIGGVMAVLIIIILVIVLILVIFRRRRNNKGDDSRAIRKNSDNGVSAVIYENEEIGYHDNTYDGVANEKTAVEESAYEGVDLFVPPATVPPTKPAIQPRRMQAQNANGKPVAVVLPERLENKPKPPPQPKPYALYAKEKSESNASLDSINKKKEPEKRSEKPPVAPRDRSGSTDNLAPSVGLKDQSGSRDNLGERGGEEMDSGDIYQNVTLPGVVLATELEEYIKSKKKGNTNELVHDFSLLNINQLHPWEVASKEKNKAKNRFRNIIAYDHSRVVLEKVDGDPHSDYYNANYINDYKGERAFIASQAPNTASLTSFWRMIWQENVSTIVMVTNLIEAGKDRCRQYWPKNPRSVEVMGDFSLFLLETEQFSDHVVRTLIVKKAGNDDDDEDNEEKRTIKQYHYLSWPDMGVPEYSTTLITFTEDVKQHHTRLQSTGHKGPMLVHCSAGVGRTGTFICLYNMLDMMRKEGKVDIFGFISKMRDKRIKMVQTKEQYVFLYNALLEVYLSGNTAIPVAKFQEKLDTLNRANSATKKANIQVEFENLHTLTPTPAASSFRGGRSPSNRKKNRFSDILPMERSRPYLASAGLADSTDYINASFLNTFLKKDVFLATQSPLPNTVVDLWRLVFDWKCPVIVMLNELDGETCVQYWPEEGSMLLGSLEITALESESTMNFVKRRFSVTSNTGESVTVEQFEMLGWGISHNKPDSPLSLLRLIEAVEISVKAAENKGPAIVHCINGIGRSGVFCALWSVMEKVRRDNTVDIFQAVKRLRCNRPNMVETLDQYQLCYDVMNQHLQQFEEYANLDIL